MLEPMGHFQTATLEVGGATYRVEPHELEPLVTHLADWIGGSPSTWVCVDVFRHVRRRFPDLGQGHQIALAAQALGMAEDQLVAAIEWHENYMRWHDGDESYRVLEP